MTGSVYPWQLVFLFFGVIVLAISIYSGQSLPTLILATIVLGVGFRAASMQIPVPVAGDDANSNLVWIEQLIEFGSIDQIESTFYRDASFHYVFIAISSLVFGLGPERGIHIYAPLMGIVVPLIAVVLTNKLGIEETHLLALAALLAVVTTEAIRRTHRPLAQTHASIFWWLFLISLIMYLRSPNNRMYSLLTFFAVSIVFTHKLPLPIIGILIGVLLLLHIVNELQVNTNRDRRIVKHLGGVLVLLGLVTIVQWLYISDLINQIVARINAFIFGLSHGADVGETMYEPSAAVPARPGLLPEIYQYPVEYSLYFERSHAIILLIVSGLGWLALYQYREEREQRSALQVLLVAAAICVFLIMLGQVSVSAMNPTRPLLLIEPVLVTLIIGLVWRIQKKYKIEKNQLRSKLMYLFIITIAFSQIFAATAAADYVNTPRYYLDKPEQQGQETLCTYTEGQIYVDQEYTAFSNCDKFRRISRTSRDELYNAEIEPNEHGTVMYRHNVNVYLGVQNRWRLTWNPDDKLSQEYNKIYDNNAVSAFNSS